MLVLLSAFVITSCKKNNNEPPATPTIQADWKLATDTVTVGSNLDLAYQGLSGDYYNFASDGKLYVNEGKYGRDTAEYALIGDTAITLTKVNNGQIAKWGGLANPWRITVLTAHKMIFTSGAAIPGAGWMEEVITLTK
jgi:hypothetical protein